MNLDDNALIKRIKRQNDKDAANKLVEFYYDEIYRYAYRQLLNKDSAMDITQEIFISALRGVPTFDSRKAGFRTFIYRIATNKIIDIKRKTVPEIVQIDNLEIVADTDFEKQLEDKELLLKIDGYVSGLSSELQQIYRMHIYGQLTFAEIGSIKKVSESTVKTKYYRLIKTIREEFSNEYRDANR